MSDGTEQLAIEVGNKLVAKGLTLVTAESCTGGWIAKVVTDVPGCSAWFDGGFVTYSNAAKIEQLGVRSVTLESHGAVSSEAVMEMAEGALRRSEADVAVAVSGVAGPGGGTAEKPVGTVWLAWARNEVATVTEKVCLAGDRDAIRRETVARALRGILAHAG